MASRRAQSTFFCCSPRIRSTMLFGAKHPCLAQAMATIPGMSQAFDNNMASSIARNEFSHGAFCECRNSLVKKNINCSSGFMTYVLQWQPSCGQRIIICGNGKTIAATATYLRQRPHMCGNGNGGEATGTYLQQRQHNTVAFKRVATYSKSLNCRPEKLFVFRNPCHHTPSLR
jgi:hypothetical protein